MSKELDYTQLDYRQWTFLQRLLQWIARLLIGALTRIEAEGLDHMPSQGPLIIAPNHLHMLDVPVFFPFISRRTVVFAADKWQNVPVIGWILSRAGDAIYVARGTPDRRALAKALKVLQCGGALAVAPEGTRSHTGGLGKGHTGVAYLATRTSAPILPVVAYGQERCFLYWKRLRRVPVHVKFGQPIVLPPGKWPVAELEKQTEQVMMALAHLLPPEYRGIYADRIPGD